MEKIPQSMELDEDAVGLLEDDLSDNEDAVDSLEDDHSDIVTFAVFYDDLNTDELQESWPIVESSVQQYGLTCTLDLVESKMSVSKTSRTEDPDVLFTAKDVLMLLSCGFPPRCAVQILDCSNQYEIIWIGNVEGGICNVFGITKERFLERKKLLTVQVFRGLRDVTGCHIVMKGTTVAVIGSLQGIKLTRKIVEECIAYGRPPAPRVQKLKRKHQSKKSKRLRLTSEVTMNLDALCV